MTPSASLVPLEEGTVPSGRPARAQQFAISVNSNPLDLANKFCVFCAFCVRLDVSSRRPARAQRRAKTRLNSVDKNNQHDHTRLHRFFVCTVPSRVQQATSCLSSRLNSVDKEKSSTRCHTITPFFLRSTIASATSDFAYKFALDRVDK